MLSLLKRFVAGLPLLLICAFIAAPLLMVVLFSFTASSNFRFPPSEFSVRWYSYVLQSSAWMDAVAFSGQLLLLVVPATVVLGTLGGYAVGAGRFPGRGVLSLFFLSPLAVPAIMIGLALLFQLQGMGLVGNISGLWMAHVIATFPFCVRVIAVSAAAIDPALLSAARSLGASSLRTFFTVSLPLLRPGIVASVFLALVVSLSEVAMSVLLTGVGTATVPVHIYSAVQQQLDPSVAAVSTIMLVVSVIMISVLDRRMLISH